MVNAFNMDCMKFIKLVQEPISEKLPLESDAKLESQLNHWTGMRKLIKTRLNIQTNCIQTD